MGLWNHLKKRVTKKQPNICNKNVQMVFRQHIDEETLDNIEDALIMADCGYKTAVHLRQKIAQAKPLAGDDGLGVYRFLADEITHLLTPYQRALLPESITMPHVIMVVGVNGVGKTTSIAKCAYYIKQQGHTILLGAGDSFRAGATEQLTTWAERLDVPMIKSTATQQDPASIAYQTLEYAHQHHHHIVLFDTAGRMHTKHNLMEELKKIERVMQKFDTSYPQQIIMVIDATTGQNALNQIQAFSKIVDISGLIITKLDGTAKGGMVLNIVEQTGLPIYAIGVGEQMEDFQHFNAYLFAHALLGLETASL